MPKPEKTLRNEQMYEDYLKGNSGKGMSTYELAEKYRVRQPRVHQIITRMKKLKGGE